MIGTIIGDIAGSIYEFDNIKTKDFPLFGQGCSYTDDSIMAIAVADTLLSVSPSVHEEELRFAFAIKMKKYGRKYPWPMGGYGVRFKDWLTSNRLTPYGSFGNGSAMRVAACGYAASSLDEAYRLARCSAEVTHNHPEGIKGAQCVASCIYMAANGESKEQIKEAVEGVFYKLDKTLKEIRPGYRFNESCQGTVPQAIQAFLESTDFEDAIRNAISIGGDSDTLAAITGGIAEAYYGVPEKLAEKAFSFLSPELERVVREFEEKYGKG